jgi:triosephosphate isomerase
MGSPRRSAGRGLTADLDEQWRPQAGAADQGAVDHGLADERGETERKLRNQVQEGLEKVSDERLAGVVIAYEPIWAIGTGHVATPEQAQEAIGFVRALVADRSREAAELTRVLYGGSVKPENAADILIQPDVDGALVGGASLDPDSFAQIVAAAAP